MNFILKLLGLQTVDSILSDLYNKVAQLDVLYSKYKDLIVANEEVISSLKDKNMELTKDSTRARAVATKIKDLLNG